MFAEALRVNRLLYYGRLLHRGPLFLLALLNDLADTKVSYVKQTCDDIPVVFCSRGAAFGLPPPRDGLRECFSWIADDPMRWRKLIVRCSLAWRAHFSLNTLGQDWESKIEQQAVTYGCVPDVAAADVGPVVPEPPALDWRCWCGHVSSTKKKGSHRSRNSSAWLQELRLQVPHRRWFLSWVSQELPYKEALGRPPLSYQG